MPLMPVSNPPNPWASSEVDYLGDPPIAELQVFEDHSRSILSTNDSPDVGFRWSVNPYRGCQHACAYCYARRTHEYLSFGAGTDFDRKIVVKPDAPALLREALTAPSWNRELVAFSGVTDCYQPLEASYRLTRACLEVCAELANPVGIVTKGPLVERDLDVLVKLRDVAGVHVAISIPMWSKDRARALEPLVATPERRMKTIATLAAAGIETWLLCSPMIPSLTDEELPELLERAKEAGATGASMGFLRLPGSVRPVFEERLHAAMPMRADRVLSLVRQARSGALDDARFGVRQTGEGAYAESVRALFEQTARRLGLETSSRLEVAAERRSDDAGLALVAADAPKVKKKREKKVDAERPKRAPKGTAASAQLALFGEPGA
ncbi:PA0069 family radical SAM protein [Myxococcota bacterium]|nr:PA0069 family radical SAM protein [Myxococcota bacterium]